ncbi:unnamed protein product [Toxocara canis]|uniref:HTH psq-type domain-containing protein n=1 Tax=Toxocara canis TaxID=6265 RepID=A0A183V1P1_TOXCA|nr:unnamed protein product [Toxocara canis]
MVFKASLPDFQYVMHAHLIPAMQEVVWNAVSSCQYDDPEKKERLCTAVMDALSGEKTLKASSFFHGVPFTTVQTYFHRSREAMTKAMLTIDERDNEPPNQIQVPVPLTTASYDGHSSDSEQSNEKKCGKLDSVLGLLAAKMEQRANSEENSASPDCYAPTGSNKRKPKSVHRVVNEPIANDEEGTFADSLYDMVYFGSSDEFKPSLYGQPGVTVDGEMSDTTSDELDGSEGDALLMFIFSVQDITGYEVAFADFAGDEYARKVAEGIVERSAVGKSTKVRLAKAIVKEACERYCLTTDYLEAYFGAFREVMQQSGSTSFIAWNGFADTGTTSNVTVSDGLSEANGSKGSKVSDGKKGCEKESYVVGPPLDPSDKKRIAAIDACIEDVCKPSLYSAEQKEKLHKAISMVVRGERTVNAAANIMQLPSSTLHPYVHKARVALGSLLPPQASGPTLWNSNKKIHEAAEQSSPATESNEETNQNTSINLEEIDEVLTGLLKNANCDESSKDKIYQATLMVRSFANICL